VVLLLDDPEFGVGARLAREGTLGLARGDGDGRLVYTQVEGGPVQVGEALLTTGSDTFVPDVPIGVVREVRSTAGGLTSAADIEPYADVAALDLVGVVVEGPRPPRVRLP
jgi:rod shape-determining protein MreC